MSDEPIKSSVAGWDETGKYALLFVEKDASNPEQLYCKECHSYLDGKPYGIIGQAAQEPSGTLKLLPERNLFQVCVCRRWARFDFPQLWQRLDLDEDQTDDSYWKPLFERIRAEFKPQDIANIVVKILKEKRHRARQYKAQFHWDRDLPKEDVDWAWSIISEWNLDCMDNVRVAIKGVQRQERAYRKQKSHGCCGSYDIEMRRGILDSRVFLLGCNYGH